MIEMVEADVYPVGLLKDLLSVWGTTRRAPAHMGGALRKLMIGLGAGWRRRSYWSGYLAEPTSRWVAWTRAGHGWTPDRAMRDLAKHVLDVRP